MALLSVVVVSLHLLLTMLPRQKAEAETILGVSTAFHAAAAESDGDGDGGGDEDGGGGCAAFEDVDSAELGDLGPRDDLYMFGTTCTRYRDAVVLGSYGSDLVTFLSLDQDVRSKRRCTECRVCPGSLAGYDVWCGTHQRRRASLHKGLYWCRACFTAKQSMSSNVLMHGILQQTCKVDTKLHESRATGKAFFFVHRTVRAET